MADAPSKQAKFWSSTGISRNDVALVPGVNDIGNKRPKAKVKGGKTREVKASVPIQQPVLVEMRDEHGGKTSCPFLSSDISSTITTTDISALHSKGVTLKDLCPDDKKRIANLIKELAKVGEEKENAEENLSVERSHYQQQILCLVQQQEAILREREDVQNRLLEYQSYIVKLQQQQQLQQLLHHQERHRQQHQQQHDPIQQHQQQHHPHQQHQQHKDREMDKRLTTQSDNADVDDDDADDDDDVVEEEVEEDLPSGQPSGHLYMNELFHPETGTPDDDVTVPLAPSKSPPHQQTAADMSRPLPHRPFTAMIDEELCRERKKTDGAVNVKLKGAEKNGSEERAGGIKHLMLKDSKERKEENVVDVSAGPTVSPEKAEIFTRFMDSQSKVQLGTAHGYNGREKGHRGWHGGGKNDGTVDGKKTKKKNKGEERGKSLRRPVASAGAFHHPPIMSSTQKSSEIGDYMSNVDSTIVSDKAVEIGGGGDGGDVADVAGIVKADLSFEGNGDQSKMDFTDNHDGVDVDGHGYIGVDVDGHGYIGVDEEFLCYYKQLTASERKQELLKQRAILMEEQNKLRHQLMQQQRQQQQQKRLKRKERMDEKENEQTRNRLTRKEAVGGRRLEEVVTPMCGMKGVEDAVVSEHKLKKGRALQNIRGRLGHVGQEVAIVSSKGKSKGYEDEAVRIEEEQQMGVTLKGSDGDECITYASSMPDGKQEVDDIVVKKLEYSELSDADGKNDVNTAPSRLNQKFIVSPSSSAQNPLSVHDTNMAASSLPVMVDAGTSISFAGFIPDFTNTESVNIQGPVLSPPLKSSHMQSDGLLTKPRVYESPGDKTLAVVEMMNSIPDNSAFPPGCVTKRRTVTSESWSPKAAPSATSWEDTVPPDSVKKTTLTAQRRSHCQNEVGHGWRRSKVKAREGVGIETRGGRLRAGLGLSSELDQFVFDGCRKRQLEGCPMVIGEYDKEEDTFYEYDDGEDSYIDDIVEGLLSSDKDDVDIDDDSDEDVECMVRSLNAISAATRDLRARGTEGRMNRVVSVGDDDNVDQGDDVDEFDADGEDNDDDDVDLAVAMATSRRKLGTRNTCRHDGAVSVGVGGDGETEETDILRDIFFVTH